ncbi:replication factor C subunit 1, partial [Ascosphaera atra]
MPANGGSGKAGEDYAAKKKAEEERVRKMAEEIDREERRRREEAKQSETAAQAAKPTRVQGPQAATSRTPSAQAPASGAATPGRVDDRLWTVKYAPTSLGMICGNKAPVERLQNWLHNWRNNAKAGFKKPGRDGSGIYRSVMLHGPPGIGKTTAAHLVAKIEGYDIVESNASDTRSKKLVEEGLRGVLDTTSLGGYFAGAGKNVQATKKNLVLIMDEVDGMSAGDRGGVGALAAVARKTNVPMILICNERSLPKMRPFDRSVFEIPFRRP